MRVKAVRCLLGAGVIFAGIYYLGSFLWNWPSLFFEGWWTLLIIIPAVADILANRLHFGNIAFLGLGFWLLAREREWADPYILNAGAIAGVVILIGISIVWGAIRPRRNMPW